MEINKLKEEIDSVQKWSDKHIGVLRLRKKYDNLPVLTKDIEEKTKVYNYIDFDVVLKNSTAGNYCKYSCIVHTVKIVDVTVFRYSKILINTSWLRFYIVGLS